MTCWIFFTSFRGSKVFGQTAVILNVRIIFNTSLKSCAVKDCLKSRTHGHHQMFPPSWYSARPLFHLLQLPSAAFCVCLPSDLPQYSINVPFLCLRKALGLLMQYVWDIVHVHWGIIQSVLEHLAKSEQRDPVHCRIHPDASVTSPISSVFRHTYVCHLLF